MKLRPPRLEDLRAIIEINDRVHPNPWSHAALRAELELICVQNLALSPCWGVVAEEDSKTIGYLFSRQLGGSFDLMVVGVAGPYQRRGLGRRLMNALLAQVPANSEIFLEVSITNVSAIALYESLGFKVYRQRQNYYSDGAHGVCMKLKVAKA